MNREQGELLLRYVDLAITNIRRDVDLTEARQAFLDSCDKADRVQADVLRAIGLELK